MFIKLSLKLKCCAVGDPDWTRQDDSDGNNRVNITDLTYGETYEVVIVAVNKAGETESDPKLVAVGLVTKSMSIVIF